MASSANTTKGSNNESIQIEFAVNINQPDDFAKIDELLKTKGLRLIASDAETKTIQFELEHKSVATELGDVQSLQKYIEKETGFITVVKGLGQLSSAVAELRPSEEASREGHQVIGVVRLSQLLNGRCFVDALVDGFENSRMRHPLKLQQYSLALHEFGDLSSDSYTSVGRPVIQVAVNQELGDKNKQMSVRTIVPDCDVLSMIGKSVAVTEHSMTGEEGRILSAGVIARASTVQGNLKQVCSCSGKTLWQERLDKIHDNQGANRTP